MKDQDFDSFTRRIADWQASRKAKRLVEELLVPDSKGRLPSLAVECWYPECTVGVELDDGRVRSRFEQTFRVNMRTGVVTEVDSHTI